VPAVLLPLSIVWLQFPPTGQTALPKPPELVPAAKGARWPTDSKDGQPVLLGRATREEILAHRGAFGEYILKHPIPPELETRWKSVQRPITIVCAFGSWCGDTQREIPDLLALEGMKNPFIDVIYLGVYRDKKLRSGDWPKGIPEQAFSHVPTLFFFEQEARGWKPMGSIVENPPKQGQRMAEAVLDLLEASN
jgi:hypothetical protein